MFCFIDSCLKAERDDRSEHAPSRLWSEFLYFVRAFKSRSVWATWSAVRRLFMSWPLQAVFGKREKWKNWCIHLLIAWTRFCQYGARLVRRSAILCQFVGELMEVSLKLISEEMRDAQSIKSHSDEKKTPNATLSHSTHLHSPSNPSLMKKTNT